MAPDLKKATYPLRIYHKLLQAGYRVDPDTHNAMKNPSVFMRDLFDTLRIRMKIILDLLDSEEWDFFIAVVTETDRLHHFFWHVQHDPSHIFHQNFFDMYREIDRFFGKVLLRLGSDRRLVVLSDHGFGALRKEFYINHWLRGERIPAPGSTRTTRC